MAHLYMALAVPRVPTAPTRTTCVYIAVRCYHPGSSASIDITRLFDRAKPLNTCVPVCAVLGEAMVTRACVMHIIMFSPAYLFIIDGMCACTLMQALHQQRYCGK